MQLKSLKDIPEEHWVTGGHSLCAGCGAAIGLKLALAALGPRTVVINTSSCFTMLPTYPYTPFRVPWLHLAMECGGATATGIDSALAALRKKGITILAYIGDGSTYDIGLQSLSCAMWRGDNFIWVCYNNQNYANTGHQATAATPERTWTTTTPQGNPLWRKPMTKIAAAHNLPYVATACISYPVDFANKLRKAQAIQGPKFIDLLTPCVPGWGYEPARTVEVGKLAVESCAWPLYEIEKGKFLLNHRPKPKRPVKGYLRAQGRFRHLKDAAIGQIQSWIDAEWAALSKGDFWGAREY